MNYSEVMILKPRHLWPLIVFLMPVVIAPGCFAPSGFKLAQGAPLPFKAPHPWLPDPVGEYRCEFFDGVQAEPCVCRIWVRRDGTASYRYEGGREPFKSLRWRLKADGELVLFDAAGIGRYWLPPVKIGRGGGYKIRRVR